MSNSTRDLSLRRETLLFPVGPAALSCAGHLCHWGTPRGHTALLPGPCPFFPGFWCSVGHRVSARLSLPLHPPGLLQWLPKCHQPVSRVSSSFWPEGSSLYSQPECVTPLLKNLRRVEIQVLLVTHHPTLGLSCLAPWPVLPGRAEFQAVPKHLRAPPRHTLVPLPGASPCPPSSLISLARPLLFFDPPGRQPGAPHTSLPQRPTVPLAAGLSACRPPPPPLPRSRGQRSPVSTHSEPSSAAGTMMND